MEFEVVSLGLSDDGWRCEAESNDAVQFVRVDQVVAALEGLAAEYERESQPIKNPDGSKSYPLVSIQEAATDLTELAANLKQPTGD